MPPQPFIILTTQRTGSTYIRLWLNQLNEVKSHGEVFLPGYPAPDGFLSYLQENNKALASIYRRKYFHRFSKRLNLGSFLFTPFKNPTVEYLKQLFFEQTFPLPFDRFIEEDVNTMQTTKLPQKAVGFKIMWEHLSNNYGIQEWIETNHPKFIHINRVNKVGICISKFMNRKTGIAHTESTIDLQPFVIPKSAFRRCLKKQHYNEQKIQEYLASKDHLSIMYEDFFGKEQNSCKRRVQEYLGLSNFENPTSVSIKKITRKKPEEIIINYTDLVEIAENITL